MERRGCSLEFRFYCSNSIVQLLWFDFYCSTSSLQKGRLSCIFLAPKVTSPLPVPLSRIPPARASALFFARIIQVRHRSHATYSRQPRQVRKEATVTGSCVCSVVPVPGLSLTSDAETF